MDPIRKLGTLDFDDDDKMKERIGKGKIKTHVSLFSGCGGLDVGFANAGIQTRVMIEYAHDACETLRCNFLWEYLKKRTTGGHYVNKDGTELDGPAITGKCEWKKGSELKWQSKEEMKKDISWYHEPEPVILEKDICDVTTEEIMKVGNLQIGECSIISGGFPCQGFSLAGARVLEDPRNKLYKQFVRIVDEMKPASIMGENVPGLVSMGKGQVIHQICEDFAACGYDIAWDILDAVDFGVPQHRKRVILIGTRVDAMTFNEGCNPAFHIAATPGEISHPHLFKERLKRWRTKESKELLEKIEKDPMCNFVDKNLKMSLKSNQKVLKRKSNLK